MKLLFDENMSDLCLATRLQAQWHDPMLAVSFNKEPVHALSRYGAGRAFALKRAGIAFAGSCRDLVQIRGERQARRSDSPGQRKALFSGAGLRASVPAESR